ncbi:DUF4112 domain-containing protein [Prevotella salivae]|jgi:hypothetical protein|uniref:DUF4112 domain-containing protein n=1 Tax=Segatella salivae TaxID=228604 RepID=UPI001C5ECB22|nr:DUF4112 domain-containing protein [Segatella salivae]MBF1521785.1 DUF4112 domain-containing protein [Segatella salivae]MBW4764037.1 DUF4112 domain-containing protein [Segatella salivae]
MSKEIRKEALRNSKLYHHIKKVTQLADGYYLDFVIGLIPGGFGDILGGLFSLSHVYFGLFKLRSIPLTLALLNNMLRDVFLGMLPFYVGDAIDFFYKSNKKNMALIEGFVNDDKQIIQQVNKKAIQAAIVFFLLIAGIMLLLGLLVLLANKIGSILFT